MQKKPDHEVEPTRPKLRIQEWVRLARLLVLSDHADETSALQKVCGCSQAEAVTHFMEESCWAEDFPQYQGNAGTVEERITALRKAWADADAQAATH